MYVCVSPCLCPFQKKLKMKSFKYFISPISLPLYFCVCVFHEHLPLCHYYSSTISPYTQHCSALVGYTEFQYGDELPLLIAARGLLIFCLRWRDFLFVIRKLLQKLGSDFFGWRLCVVDVCVRVRCSWHSRALVALISLSLCHSVVSPIHGHGTSLEAAC